MLSNAPKRSLQRLARFGLVATFALLGGCALPTGLTRSRWAMEDPEYAEKYATGAEKADVAGKLKQASDARFVAGSSGLYVSGGLASRTDSGSELGALEIGYEGYFASYGTSRGALTLMGDGDDLFTGLDVGLRLQTPSRLAPFVGAGAFVGYADEIVPAEDDWVDNDDDGFIDERGEDRTRFSGALAAIYPEVGAHFWWTPTWRISSYARYMITTEGRAEDDWLIGGQIAILTK